MTSMNTVILAGRLTKDPVIRHTKSGTSVADIRLAINEKWKSNGNEWKESTIYVDLVAWGTIAETAERHLKSGRLILVEGTLQLDQWENQAGEKQSRLRVRISRFHFLDAPNQASVEGTGANTVHSSRDAAPAAEPRHEKGVRQPPPNHEPEPDSEPWPDDLF